MIIVLVKILKRVNRSTYVYSRPQFGYCFSRPLCYPVVQPYHLFFCNLIDISYNIRLTNHSVLVSINKLYFENYSSM